MKLMKYVSKVSWGSLMAGLLVGLLLFAVVRLATYSPQHTHYHANFAVYINGQRQQFKGQQYYEDVAACSAYEDMTPKKRVHMHNNVNDVVHVHDNAVTWGAFFQNLGWAIGADYIKTDTALLQNDDTREVTFILNGQDQPDVTNKVINDDDRLLVSYGAYDKQQVQSQFKTIAESAEEHDHTKDPASCSGPDTPTFKDRLKHILDTK